MGAPPKKCEDDKEKGLVVGGGPKSRFRMQSGDPNFFFVLFPFRSAAGELERRPEIAFLRKDGGDGVGRDLFLFSLCSSVAHISNSALSSFLLEKIPGFLFYSPHFYG